MQAPAAPGESCTGHMRISPVPRHRLPRLHVHAPCPLVVPCETEVRERGRRRERSRGDALLHVHLWGRRCWRTQLSPAASRAPTPVSRRVVRWTLVRRVRSARRASAARIFPSRSCVYNSMYDKSGELHKAHAYSVYSDYRDSRGRTRGHGQLEAQAAAQMNCSEQVSPPRVKSLGGARGGTGKHVQPSTPSKRAPHRGPDSHL